MENLWSRNTPEQFWLCQPSIPAEVWQEAVRAALPLLRLPHDVSDDWAALPEAILGEGQLGPDHWDLGLARRAYYWLKPLIPANIRRLMRRSTSAGSLKDTRISWPADTRYAAFLWETLRQVMLASGKTTLQTIPLWPDRKSCALILTHDVETAAGQEFVRAVADLEEGLGFRSCFNFVLERYPLDLALLDELRARGFEVGCHGLKHDGKLFNSRALFERRAKKINVGMKSLAMSGFRSPLTLRQPEWMQSLEIDYDASFFDTDPFEPIPGGTLSLWPFFLGRFVELPYTLAQDHTLTAVLGEKTPRLWLEKLDVIQKYHGMALLITHPDYLSDRTTTWQVYAEFLREMQAREGYWHALPCEAAGWWRARSAAGNALAGGAATDENLARISLSGQELYFS